ncbi:MAG TPA: 3-hexulose-6-phosphate synthase [Candidatus Thermoplasmatota archaeon]|nr:3-hexulose-6-phosphate synthase [Candidatus Thermoplasmatota archaeon]
MPRAVPPRATPALRKAAAGPWPVLQVALDEVNLDRALQYAREAVAGGADWVEAGTPLIKACGLDAVRALKREFPGKVIVADMKTMDTGAFETEMAAKAGADVVGILGAAADGTLREAVKAARKYGAKVYMDLIGVADKVQRAREAEALGCDYVALHMGIDEQMAGESPLQVLKAVVAAVRLPVLVAGGLTSETVAPCVKAGAAVVVVGGALTKAPDVAAEARKLKAAIRDRRVIPTASFKRYGQEELAAAFRQCSTSNVSDAMHRKGAMDAGIQARQQGARIAGRAVTVFTADGDWAKPVEAIEAAQAGQILVIDARGGQTALWGELASHSSQLRGLAGVVVDGAIRDVDDIRAMGFPAWSRHVVPNAGEPKGFGEIGAEVRCGGQAVRSGDWVIADDMGVVVVPQEEAHEVANRSLEVHEREARLREEIRRGRTLASVLSLKKWEKVVG